MRKKSGMTPVIVIILAVLLLALIGLTLWLVLGGDAEQASESGTDVPTSSQTEPVGIFIEPEETVEEQDLGAGLTVVKTGRYSGMFVEDGSDEIVMDVFALTVENRSDTMVQYARFAVTVGEESYTFELTSLPAGATILVLEKDRKLLPSGLDQADVELVQRADFPTAPSMYEDIFEITTANGMITVKNISDTDINGDIFVYYKTCIDGVYMGGITYRAKISGLKAGETADCMTGHYSTQDSEILFLTYVP